MAEKLIFSSLKPHAGRVGKDDLMIVGGTIAEAKVINWLGKLVEIKGMPWRMWQWVNDFRLEHESLTPAFPLPLRLAALERVRLFGDGGDLTVRRDGELFRWHFIGPSGAPEIPLGWQSCHDYWDREGNESQKFACFEQKALLWGAYNQELERWYDNRVGFARLEYPIADIESLLQEDKKGHIYAYYREYLDAGQVAFVWMYKLGPEKEEKSQKSQQKKPFWKRLW